MKKYSLYLILLSSFFSLQLHAQTNFVRNSSIVVLNFNGDTLRNPWAGGFNSVQFSEIDLNLDGIKDLFVFDRTGNKVSTFINLGYPNQVSYVHEPDYAKFFPKDLHDWVLLRDYNCDGKMDIFTSSSGGVAVYQNNSSTQLSFSLITHQIFSDNQLNLLPNYVNLFINSTDMPAIDDIDGDGDLDFLVLSLIGNRIEYHKNLSMERYGTCDSIDYQLRNKCWGYIKESATQNKVTFLDTCLNNVVNPESTPGSSPHLGGSSLFTLDIDSNNSKDLVISGNSYNNFLLLYNDDTSANLESSSISSQQSSFPSTHLNTIALELEHFPAGFYMDVNNDGIKDLVSSTNSTTFCKNTTNVWYFENNNADNRPDFNFITNSFLQEGMIEVGQEATPVFFDYNADGLLDVVVGNYGYYDSGVPGFYISSLWLYENIGTLTTPIFKLIDSNYVNISTLNLDVVSNKKTLGLSPTFGDLDGDGDKDMIVGDYIGYLHYFENNAGAGNPANFVLSQAQYFNIDVGNNAKPQLIDLNRDLLLDLVVGKENGYFSYYQNVGTNNLPNYSLITDSLGEVNTKRSYNFNGNSAPFVYDDGSGYKMLSGSSNGYIYQFGNIDGNLNGIFTIDSSFSDVWEGINSTVSLTDINTDGILDLLIGNYSGGVAHYQGDTSAIVSVVEVLNIDQKINIYPNPSSNKINVRSAINVLEIQIFDLSGRRMLTSEQVNKAIDVSYFPNGIYFIKVIGEENTLTKKFVKH